MRMLRDTLSMQRMEPAGYKSWDAANNGKIFLAIEAAGPSISH